MTWWSNNRVSDSFNSLCETKEHDQRYAMQNKYTDAISFVLLSQYWLQEILVIPTHFVTITKKSELKE